jgi:hypothetical protein
VIENYWANAAYSLIPTILLGLIFWLVMRSIFRADRTERTVYAEIEAEERARLATENAATENAATEKAAAVGSTAAAAREPSA